MNGPGAPESPVPTAQPLAPPLPHDRSQTLAVPRMDSVFDMLNPDWSRYPAVRVTGPAVQDGARVHVPTDAGRLTIAPLPDGVRLTLGGEGQPDYGILADVPWSPVSQIVEEEGATRIAWGLYTLTIRHAPFALDFRRWDRPILSSATDAHFVREFRLPPLARVPTPTGEGWFVSLGLGSHDAVYGLGEKWGALDRRGQLVHSYTYDALGVNAERSYKNAPFAWSPAGWGVFVHTPAPVHHGVGFAQWSHRSYGIVLEDEGLDLFLLAGDTGAEVIERYTALTGRMPMPPAWSMGTILSRAYYRTADEFLAAAREARDRGLPCDTITLDGRAWLDTRTRFAFEWDASRYPDPKAVLDEVHALGFKVCVWEYPLVSVEHPLFAEMSAKGWLLKDGETGDTLRYVWDKEPFGAVLTPLPDSGIVDFTHPDAYAFWRDSHEALLAVGVDMIKTDFGEQVGDNAVAHNGDTGRRLHNVYPLLYNACVFEAMERHAPDGGFLFGRAGWAGSQRYPAQWGGDPQADWEGLAASIRGGLSWGASGAPCYATDIGGFYADNRDPELFVRWTQAAIFSSHIRFHGIGTREPWSYGPQAEAAVRAALALRYRLLPYLWKTLAEAHETGLPVQRLMALAFPDTPPAWAFETQFLFGDDLLVVPATEPGGKVRFYLPEGRWHDWATGDVLEGGGRVYQRRLLLDEIALFARDGAAIPLGPETDRIGDTVPETAEIRRFG